MFLSSDIAHIQYPVSVVLVDECTSGVDPLSRRAVWKTLTSFREDRSIVFTTHVCRTHIIFNVGADTQLCQFLDEADLLADHIAILAAPGKVVASGSPVALKRDLGQGYSIQVSFTDPIDLEKMDPDQLGRPALLRSIKEIAPLTYVISSSSTQSSYHLKTRDVDTVRNVLAVLDSEVQNKTISSYDILGTTIEDIFLDLMSKNDALLVDDSKEKESEDVDVSEPPIPLSNSTVMNLPTGRPVSPFKQTLTILHKRLLISRRSWLTPLLTVGIAIAGACIPLIFIKGRRHTCVKTFQNTTSVSLYLPTSPIVPFTFGFTSQVAESPPDIIETLGSSTDRFRTRNMADKMSFSDYISQNHRNLSLGGISVDTTTGESLFAWEASPPGITGPSMLNLASNVLYNRALNSSGRAGPTPTIIRANYAPFPPVAAGTLSSLRWILFFGAAMVLHPFPILLTILTDSTQAVYPAFYSLYVSKERRSSVQAMQLSNGLTNPIGLWLGHLMFDLISVTFLSTVIVIVFAVAPTSSQFHGLGYLVCSTFTFVSIPDFDTIPRWVYVSVVRDDSVWYYGCALLVSCVLDGSVSIGSFCNSCRLSICRIHCTYFQSYSSNAVADIHGSSMCQPIFSS